MRKPWSGASVTAGPTGCPSCPRLRTASAACWRLSRASRTRCWAARASADGGSASSWNNITAGYDPFNTDCLEIYEGGVVLVGVTAQRVGIEVLPVLRLAVLAYDRLSA